MVIVKSVYLKNYCGYEEVFFDFSEEDGGVKSLAVFFGPNGVGKSTALNAIKLAANPQQFRGRERESDLVMRKSIHDKNYIPTADNMKKDTVKKDMLIDVNFLTDDGERRVVLDNMGLLKNELPPYENTINSGGYVYFADADHPINNQKFQLHEKQTDKFLDFAREVYGYDCYLDSPIAQKGHTFYLDFIIQKGDVHVHYKSMSAGEKKIATLISDLCQPINTHGRDIILIDNVEMHVYYKRHARMVNKLCNTFPEKQIICTTHSSIVIDHIPSEYHFDLEVYRPDYALMETDFSLKGRGGAKK